MSEMISNPSEGRRKPSHNERFLRWSKKSADIINAPYPNKETNFIDWDDPRYAIKENDRRWILPEGFDLGAHEWYQTLPEKKKIEIGMKRIANVVRTGLEFEQALISGISVRTQLLTHPKYYEEFRSFTHEAEEEQRHILMFNELNHRIGVRTYGSPNWFRTITPLIGAAARKAPIGFYASVLAGEEPIDHVQRQLSAMHEDFRRAKEKEEREKGIIIPEEEKDLIHPLVYKVMKVHVEEEARHIGIAEELLDKYMPAMSETQLKLFAKIYPAITRAGINATLLPSDETLRYMGVPKQVAKEVWFDSDYGRQTLRDLSFRARRRAEKLGLRDERLLGKTGKKVWELCGIDGSTARQRN